MWASTFSLAACFLCRHSADGDTPNCFAIRRNDSPSPRALSIAALLELEQPRHRRGMGFRTSLLSSLWTYLCFFLFIERSHLNHLLRWVCQNSQISTDFGTLKWNTQAAHSRDACICRFWNTQEIGLGAPFILVLSRLGNRIAEIPRSEVPLPRVISALAWVFTKPEFQ